MEPENNVNTNDGASNETIEAEKTESIANGVTAEVTPNEPTLEYLESLQLAQEAKLQDGAAQKVIEKEQKRLAREDKGEVWKQSQVIVNRFYQFSNSDNSFTAVVLAVSGKQLTAQRFRNGREAETVELNWRDYDVREITREQAHEWSVV